MERTGHYRREFLKYAGAVGAGLVLGQSETVDLAKKPIIMAIRWDAWHAGNRWENNLRNPLFYNNLPSFAEVDASGRVKVDGSSQAVMEQQDYDSTQAGIDAYACVYYDPEEKPNDANFSEDLRLYNYYTNFCRQRNFSPDSPNYSLILQGGHVGNSDNWPHFNDLLSKHFESDRYLKTPDGRPVISMFYVEQFYKEFGGVDRARGKLDYLRDRVRIQIGQEPLLIALNPEAISNIASFDGVSAYTALNYNNKPGLHPFADLAEANRGYWRFLANTGKLVVPPVNVSWDPRARFNDDLWKKNYIDYATYIPPTPVEFAAHAGSALDWLARNNQDYEIILFNSLNEYDESGKTLSRLLNEGTVYLDSLSMAIKSHLGSPSFVLQPI